MRGRRLTLARVAWLAIAGVSVTLLILLVPINLRGIYFDWQFQETYPVVAPLLSRAAYAAYVLTLDYAVTLIVLSIAFFIAWRKADDPMAWLTAAVLVMIPIMFSLGGYSETWSYYPSPGAIFSPHPRNRGLGRRHVWLHLVYLLVPQWPLCYARDGLGLQGSDGAGDAAHRLALLCGR